ncbi:MAG TPA: hypothetical protein VIL49_00795 [Capillimicrobium sp.]
MLVFLDISMLMGASVAAMTAWAVWHGSVVLRADAAGLALLRGPVRVGDTATVGAVTLPWTSVDAVTVGGGIGGATVVSARLKPTAPLPDDVRGILRDAEGRATPPAEVRAQIAGDRLNRAALAAVAQHAGVRVVEGTR